MNQSKMKLGHVIYKVSNLDRAVDEYRKKGFIVEYGKKKKPYNAVIYFADGPYLEFLHRTPMPSFMKKMLSLLGKKEFVRRLDLWNNSEEGLIGLALENDRLDVERECLILHKYQQKYFSIKTKRIDPRNRILQFTTVFPDSMEIPFLSAQLNVDVRPPKNHAHPNGVRRIKSVEFGTKEEFIPIIEELCDDSGLHLFTGRGVRNLEFDHGAKNYPR